MGYLVAVVVGCASVGALLPLSDIIRGLPLSFERWVIWPLAGGVFAIFPGPILCLPGALASFWISQRFHLMAAGWYPFFGSINGSSFGVLLILGNSPMATLGAYVPSAFALAGALSGLVYRLIEKAEENARSKA